MTAVHVHVTNKTGGKVALTLDDELDAERIQYLKKLVKRDELEAVSVKPAKAAKPAATAEKPDEKAAATPPKS